MANGKTTMRDMVIRIDERTLNMDKLLDGHIKNHKWFLGIVVCVPAAIAALIFVFGR